jgi:hypothetical protein
MRKLAFAFGSLLFATACATPMGYIFDPAISSDKLDEQKEPNKLKGLKGDRRLIRTHRRGEDVYEVCAETQADAISGRSPKSSITVETEGEFSDELLEALTKTVDRGEISDVVRQLHWNTCSARMSGYITNEQFYAEMQAIRSGALEALAAASKR